MTKSLHYLKFDFLFGNCTKKNIKICIHTVVANVLAGVGARQTLEALDITSAFLAGWMCWLKRQQA